MLYVCVIGGHAVRGPPLADATRCAEEAQETGEKSGAGEVETLKEYGRKNARFRDKTHHWEKKIELFLERFLPKYIILMIITGNLQPEAKLSSSSDINGLSKMPMSTDLVAYNSSSSSSQRKTRLSFDGMLNQCFLLQMWYYLFPEYLATVDERGLSPHLLPDLGHLSDGVLPPEIMCALHFIKTNPSPLRMCIVEHYDCDVIWRPPG